MQIRTIAAALVVAAPLLALGGPQAAACWVQAMDMGLLLPPRP